MRGLAFVAPIAITVYVCYPDLRRVLDRRSIPGPAVGSQAWDSRSRSWSIYAGRISRIDPLGAWIDHCARQSAINRLPFVRLLYSSTKDLLNAFVGEKRRFDTPVLVPAPDAPNAKAVGFVTQESLTRFGLTDHVAVYLPFSYSLSGRLYIYPASEVVRLTTPSAEAMAFVVSGGVTESTRGA